MARAADGRNPTFFTLLRFGSLNFPIALLALPIYAYVPTLYTDAFGLSFALVGAVMFGTRILDAVSDPLIGWLSDHTGGRYGRRRPWLALSVPFTALSAWMLFAPPDGADIIYLLTWSCALTVSWTALTLPLNAWAAELTGDYDGRTRIFAVRQVFALIGTMVATALPAVMAIYGWETLRNHVWAIGLIVVVALPLLALMVIFTVHENPARRKEGEGVMEGLLLPLRNATFRRLAIAFVINAIANGMPVSLFILFVSNVLGMPDSYGGLLFAYFLSGLVGIPLWAFIASKTTKHRAWAIAMIWSCLAFVWTPFFVGQGDYTLFFIITILSGIGVGADLAIPASILSDVVDEDTADTGSERTGFYFALWGLGSKMALGISIALAFPPLEAIGFEAGADDNSQLALMTLAFLYAGVPVVLKLISVAMMWNFPLDRARQEALRTRIETGA